MTGLWITAAVVGALALSFAVCLLVARGIDIGQNANVMPGPKQEDKP